MEDIVEFLDKHRPILVNDGNEHDYLTDLFLIKYEHPIEYRNEFIDWVVEEIGKGFSLKDIAFLIGVNVYRLDRFIKVHGYIANRVNEAIYAYSGDIIGMYKTQALNGSNAALKTLALNRAIDIVDTLPPVNDVDDTTTRPTFVIEMDEKKGLE